MSTPHEDTTAGSGEQGAGIGAVPQLHPQFIIPVGVRYDGPQTLGRQTVHCFTVTDTKPLEATFSIPQALMSNVRIARETARVRAEHRKPSAPLPPPCHCRPRQFVAGGEIHK